MMPSVVRRDAWLSSIAALSGAAFTLWLFWPGYMSWDSAVQLSEARSGQLTDIFPPLQAQIWQLADALLPGPGGMLLLQCVLYWGLILASVILTQRGRWQSPLLLLALGFLPALWAILPHIWKDVWMGLAFFAAVLLLAVDMTRPSKWTRLGSVVLIAAACAFRHNAILGAVPLLAWIVWRGVNKSAATRQWSVRGQLALKALLLGATSLLVLFASQLPSLRSDVRRVPDQWAVVALWDMAAISLEEQTLLFPPELIDRPFDLEDLRNRFRSYSNTTIFGTGMLKDSFFAPYSDPERRALYAGWLRLALAHPGAYLKHRARLSGQLFGLDRHGLPLELTLVPRLVHLPDEPPMQAARPKLQGDIQGWLNARTDGPLFAGWMYALAALVLVIRSWRHRGRHAHDGLSGVVAASGLFYALPLCVLSGSAEFRYLFWMILATALAALLAFSSPPSRRAQV
ncbi:MAG: hypothetical protein KDI75_06360 [Xanthomonadales bacterium]|nr:hypothetical protein [Xanthomonadales bacterium]